MTERRFDPTRNEWVTFATHRQDRTYKPKADFCPLCPTKSGARRTEIDRETFEIVTFDNRFPAFSPTAPESGVSSTQFHPVAPANGRCEVVVYSDDHHLTFSDLTSARVRMLVDVWVDRWKVLGSEDDIAYVMPFENKGEEVGTTLSHPHGQIYGYPFIPPVPLKELTTAEDYFEKNHRCVECDAIQGELHDGSRIVFQNNFVVAWVPFWARYPYEVHVAPKHHEPNLATMSDEVRKDFADALLRVAKNYDLLFGFSLPYIMGFHQSPTDGDMRWNDFSHLHVEFTPPHRSADKLKFLAGSESAGGAFISDVAPESAATLLRERWSTVND
ncbi:MAG: galactose-1-phosphate uridylyltransferase [Actinomycetota bacterium]|nr:galactose-1-phosphate uridylyltransferase [Actinomycetota bacterium]